MCVCVRVHTCVCMRALVCVCVCVCVLKICIFKHLIKRDNMHNEMRNRIKLQDNRE